MEVGNRLLLAILCTKGESLIIQDKVEKILKGSMDLISSPSRSHEHLNFLFLFFGAKHCWALSTNFENKQKVW